MMQIRCLQELKRLQPVGRGFQVVIAERCHISAPGINKSLKKAIEQGLITKYYTFTEYGEQWLGVYGHLVERLERYLEEIQIPESEKEKHIRMMVEDMDPFLLESILSANERKVKPGDRKYKSLMEEVDCNIGENSGIRVRIAVYRMDRRKNGRDAFSMGNRAFEPEAQLMKRDGMDYLILRIREMEARSRIDGREMTGRISSLKYEQDEELKRVKDLTEESEEIEILLEAFKMHVSPGGEIKGVLPITVTCSVGNGHMPESSALLVFWM